MRFSPLLVLVFLLAGGLADGQPSYSDHDDSDFKVNKSRSKPTPKESSFKVGDGVKFPHGTLMYSNLNDLKYYEGPETTSDERRLFKGRFLVGDRGDGYIKAVATYSSESGRSQKAYRVFIFNPGYVEGRKLSHNRLEGWLPGDYGMVKH